MLSQETKQRIRQHLRLARGLLEVAALAEASSEFDERNALSRAYYAVFHASCAWLLSAGIEPDRSHGRLHDEMQMRLGKSFGRFLRDMYELRRYADYAPGWLPIRHISVYKLRTARTNTLWLCIEAEKSLK